MKRTAVGVLVGLGLVLVAIGGYMSFLRVHGDQGSDCGTAYAPSELAETTSTEMSAGCSGAFDTIEPVAVGLALAGVALIVASVTYLITGRVWVACLCSLAMLGGLSVWLASLEGSVTRNAVGTLTIIVLALLAVGAVAAVVRYERARDLSRA